jgi:hypothetical protein
MKQQRILLILANTGLAHWFFGNLYEAIVLAPNMLVSPYEQLNCWQGFFTVTNQIYYYVPFTQLAVMVIWFLYVKEKDRLLKTVLLKASLYGLLSILLTVVIVTQLNLKIFFGDLDQVAGDLYTYTLYWVVLNIFRVILVGTTLVYACKSLLLVLESKYKTVQI